jgi:hypothetical protein
VELRRRRRYSSFVFLSRSKPPNNRKRCCNVNFGAHDGPDVHL